MKTAASQTAHPGTSQQRGPSCSPHPRGAHRAPAGTEAGVAWWDGFWWWKLGEGRGLEKPLLVGGLQRGSCQTPHGPGAAGPTASPRAATLSPAPAPGAEAISAAHPRAGEPKPPWDARSGCCRHPQRSLPRGCSGPGAQRDAHLPPPTSHFPPWPGPRPTLTFLTGYQRPHTAQDAGFVTRAGAGWVIGLHSGGVGHVPVGFSEPAVHPGEAEKRVRIYQEFGWLVGGGGGVGEVVVLGLIFCFSITINLSESSTCTEKPGSQSTPQGRPINPQPILPRGAHCRQITIFLDVIML